MRVSLTVTSLLLLGLLASCATLNPYREPPRVSLAGINLAGGSLLEQRYRLQLRVENPNPAELPIEGMTYELDVNERPFARGTSNQKVVIPKFGSELIEVEGFSPISSLLPQLRELGSGKGTVNYKLRGKAYVRSQSVPFTQQGNVTLF